jgi:hypothetical protein
VIHKFSLQFVKEKEITRQIAAINTIWKAYCKLAITHKIHVMLTTVIGSPHLFHALRLSCPHTGNMDWV